jgi:hypothetical protein
MTKFDKKQIKILQGNFTNIAKSVGCTRVYVSNVIYGRSGNKRKAPKSAAIEKKALELLRVLNASD